MGRENVSFAERDMDWQSLENVVGLEELDNWMWMHCAPCRDTGTIVHFYKHTWSRRYLRLDADGRVYKELRDGTPVALPACGGGTLLLLLIMATAHVDRGVPATITLPGAAREPCLVDHLPELAGITDYLSDELWRMIEQLEQQAGEPEHMPL